MSQENVEVVRRVYDAAPPRRDHGGGLPCLYDPDVEWDGSRSRWAEVWTGKAAVPEATKNFVRFFRQYFELCGRPSS